MTSSWFTLSTLNYDARSTTHQIYRLQHLKEEDVSSIRRSVIGCSLWSTAFDPAASHGRFVVGTSAHDVFLWRPHLHRTGSCRGHICTGRVLVEGTSAQDGFLWWAYMHRTGSCTVLMSPHYPEDGQFTHYARQSLSKPKNKCKFESIMAAIR